MQPSKFLAFLSEQTDKLDGIQDGGSVVETDYTDFKEMVDSEDEILCSI